MADNTRFGRPPAFESAEQLQQLIDAYFAKCDARVTTKFDKDGNMTATSNPEPYTMSGLALSVGVDRQTILNYSNKDNFFGTIKAARSKVEQDVERRLMETQNQTGAIFNLKNNFNWVDKSESDVNAKVSTTITVGSQQAADSIGRLDGGPKQLEHDGD